MTENLSTLRLREATIADADALIALGQEMAAGTSVEFAPISPEKIRRILGAVVDLPTAYLRIVERDGQIIGFALGQCGEPIWSDQKEAGLILLFVRRSRRGLMTARFLVDAFDSWAEAQGVPPQFRSIGVSTGENLAPLLSRCGWTQVGGNFRKCVAVEKSSGLSEI